MRYVFFVSACEHGSRTPKTAEEEAAWLRETTPKNTRNSTEWSLKIFQEWQLLGQVKLWQMGLWDVSMQRSAKFKI